MNVKKVEASWGHEVHWAANEKYTAKILHINYGQTKKRGHHVAKDKTIYVLQGILILELGANQAKNNQPDKTKILETGESYRIKPGVIHRFVAPKECYVRLVQISTSEKDDFVEL